MCVPDLCVDLLDLTVIWLNVELLLLLCQSLVNVNVNVNNVVWCGVVCIGIAGTALTLDCSFCCFLGVAGLVCPVLHGESSRRAPGTAEEHKRQETPTINPITCVLHVCLNNSSFARCDWKPGPSLFACASAMAAHQQSYVYMAADKLRSTETLNIAMFN